MLRYFSSQETIKASARVRATRLYVARASTGVSPCCRMAMPAMPIQCPPGEIFFRPKERCPWWCVTKGLQSQKAAMARCSSVRSRTVS